MKQRILLCAVLATLTILAVPLFAQDFRGAIGGTITDATGGVLPGVTVTITNAETNVATPVVTDGKGSYSLRYLISGTYNV